MLEIVIIFALLGLIPAAIAAHKGRNSIAWWIYGALLFIIALPHAVLMKPDLDAADRQKAEAGYRKCPHCAEFVKPDAKVCRFCGLELPILVRRRPQVPWEWRIVFACTTLAAVAIGISLLSKKPIEDPAKANKASTIIVPPAITPQSKPSR